MTRGTILQKRINHTKTTDISRMCVYMLIKLLKQNFKTELMNNINVCMVLFTYFMNKEGVQEL